MIDQLCAVTGVRIIAGHVYAIDEFVDLAEAIDGTSPRYGPAVTWRPSRARPLG